MNTILYICAYLLLGCIVILGVSLIIDDMPDYALFCVLIWPIMLIISVFVYFDVAFEKVFWRIKDLLEKESDDEE